jgi:glycosyltransferase involved in cell wall biosynthesis
VITFVIATVGRATLERAIASLLGQEDPKWRAILVGDGLAPRAPGDRRFRALTAEKLGHPSLVRNRAIPHVRTSWTGFLDDDDRLTPDYVAQLSRQSAGADVVVFRMRHPELGVLPRDDAVRHGNVGISFAVRTRLLRTTPFRADFTDSNEDYELLRDLERQGARIRFSADCCYLVRNA